MTSLKTVLNWEASFKCKLEKELTSGKVVKVKCVICAKYESRIKNIKGFGTSWITGTTFKKRQLRKTFIWRATQKSQRPGNKRITWTREIPARSGVGISNWAEDKKDE